MDHDRSVGSFPFFQCTLTAPGRVFPSLNSSPVNPRLRRPPMRAACTAEVTTNSFSIRVRVCARSNRERPTSGLSKESWPFRATRRFVQEPLPVVHGLRRRQQRAMQSLLDELERVLGRSTSSLRPDPIRSAFPTGKLRVDGATITTTELVKLIDRFRSDPAAVINVDIE